MKLWTFQTLNTYLKAMNVGYYYTDVTKSQFYTDENFMRCYRWLYNKMVDKIGPPPFKKIKSPVWAWRCWNNHSIKPDRRYRIFRNVFTNNTMLLELEIPNEDVVLTDFGKWEDMLLNTYIDYSESDEECDMVCNKYNAMSSEEKIKFVYESWDKVFDLTTRTKYYSSGYDIQATFWVLRKNYIQKVYKLR